MLAFSRMLRGGLSISYENFGALDFVVSNLDGICIVSRFEEHYTFRCVSDNFMMATVDNGWQRISQVARKSAMDYE